MLNMQNVKDIEITEGKVRTIHDKDSRLIWGRLAYDTKYEGDTYQQTYSGKNLLPSNPVGTTTSHNVTITVDETGRITVNGTADANVYFDLNKVTLPAGSYMLSGLPSSGSSSSFRIAFSFGGTIQSLFSVNGKTFTLDNTYTATEAFLFIAKNYTANNLVFEPMIESGSSKTSYEPYVGGIPAPNPDYPQAVQTVTGEQTVTVSDGVDSEDFTISLGSIELCKIGDYQDYIYKSGGDWYVHKKINKIPINKTATWSVVEGAVSTNYYYIYTTSYDSIPKPSSVDTYAGFCNTFVSNGAYITANTSTNKDVYSLQSGGNNMLRFMIEKSRISGMTSAAVNTFFNNNPTSIYYKLETSTDTQITDTTLVGQLNAVHEWLTRYGYNATVTGNLPIIINQTNL